MSPSAPTPARLTILAGPHAGRAFPCEGTRVVIGRGSSADVILPDDGASRAHACVEWVGQQWRLEDLGSRNGTRLNGSTIAGCPSLRSGDRIKVGTTEMRFESDEGSVADAPAPVAGCRLLTRIGTGTMAEAWRGEAADGSPRVVKRLLPDLAQEPTALASFLAGYRAQERLTHPQILRVHAAETAPYPFAVLDWAAGESLAARIGRRALAPEAALAVARQAATALQAACSQDLPHPSLHPGNILFDSADQVVLSDWVATPAGRRTAVAPYLAPEEVEGQAPSAAANQCHLGLILFHALSGQAPYAGAGDAGAIAAARQRERLDLPAGVHAPPGLPRLLARMLARDPRHRFGSWPELKQAIDAVTRGETLPPLHEESLLRIAGETARISRRPPAAVRSAEATATAVTRADATATALTRTAVSATARTATVPPRPSSPRPPAPPPTPRPAGDDRPTARIRGSSSRMAANGTPRAAHAALGQWALLGSILVLALVAVAILPPVLRALGPVRTPSAPTPAGHPVAVRPSPAATVTPTPVAAAPVAAALPTTAGPAPAPAAPPTSAAADDAPSPSLAVPPLAPEILIASELGGPGDQSISSLHFGADGRLTATGAGFTAIIDPATGTAFIHGDAGTNAMTAHAAPALPPLLDALHVACGTGCTLEAVTHREGALALPQISGPGWRWWGLDAAAARAAGLACDSVLLACLPRPGQEFVAVVAADAANTCCARDPRHPTAPLPVSATRLAQGGTWCLRGDAATGTVRAVEAVPAKAHAATADPWGRIYLAAPIAGRDHLGMGGDAGLTVLDAALTTVLYDVRLGGRTAQDGGWEGFTCIAYHDGLLALGGSTSAAHLAARQPLQRAPGGGQDGLVVVLRLWVPASSP